MAEHHEKHTIFGPFPDFDPLDTAALFLRTNRYRLVEQSQGSAPPELQVDPTLAQYVAEPDRDAESNDEAGVDVDESPDAKTDEPVVAPDPPPSVQVPDEICLSAEFGRGEKWSGLLSSSMSDLPTKLTLKLIANAIHVDYVVTTTGQILSDEERGFWKKEAQALEQYVKGSGDLFSLNSLESDRASFARRERLGSGLWIAAVIFVIVFVGGVILART